MAEIVDQTAIWFERNDDGDLVALVSSSKNGPCTLLVPEGCDPYSAEGSRVIRELLAAAA